MISQIKAILLSASIWVSVMACVSMPEIAENSAPPADASNATQSTSTSKTHLTRMSEISNSSSLTQVQSASGISILDGALVLNGAANDEYIIGNLQIVADFDSGVVDADASGFSEVRYNTVGELVSNDSIGITGGSLSGSGTINGDIMQSSLDGELSANGINADSYRIDSNLNGNFYLLYGDIVALGTVSGTSTPVQNGQDTSGGSINGAYYAN